MKLGLRNTSHIMALAACLTTMQAALANEQYSYNALGQAVGGFLYNEYMRSAVSMHCHIATPQLDMNNEQKLISWALMLYPPGDRKKAETGLRSALPDLQSQAYSQARNIFSGFFYRSDAEKQKICKELERTLGQGERENLDEINTYKWLEK